MKNPAFYIACLILTVIVECAEAGNPPLNGSVSGKVLDRATQKPISSATIMVVGSPVGTTTNEQGEFSLPSLPSGTVEIRVIAMGYAPVKGLTIEIEPDKTTNLNVYLNERHISMKEVQVSDSYFPESHDLQFGTRQISSEEFRRTPGSVEDILRTISVLPGVAQTRLDRNDFVVRGGSPAENLTVIDNIEVPGINHFGMQGAGGGNMSYINLDCVGKITFSSGGFGVKYGDRISSAMVIDLREGSEEEHKGKGTLSITQLGVELEGPHSPSGTYMISVRRSYLGYFFKLYGIGFAPVFWDFLGRASFRLGSNDQLSILGLGAIDRMELFNENEQHRADNANILFSDQNHATGGLTWKHLFRSGYSLLTLRHTSDWYYFYQLHPNLEPQFQSDSHERETSIRGDFFFEPGASTSLFAGIEARSFGFRNSLSLPRTKSFFPGWISASVQNDTTGVKGSAYLQISQVVGAFKVTLGLRGDYFDLIGKKFVASPRASIAYAPTEATTLRVHIGEYYQAPPYLWIMSNPFNTGLTPIGAHQAVVGIEHLLDDDVRISFEAYRKEYFNYPVSQSRTYLIMTNPGASEIGLADGYAAFGFDSLISAGTGTVNGIELFIQKRMSDTPLYGVFSLSYSKAMFIARDGVERPHDFDQRWIMNVTAGYLFENGWEVSSRFLYTTGRPYTPNSEDGSMLPDQYNTSRLSPNHYLNGRVTKRWNIGNYVLETFLDIFNLYNKKQADIPTHYNPETGLYEQAASLGIIPSFGIKIEF